MLHQHISLIFFHVAVTEHLCYCISDSGVKVSMNDFIVKAVAESLRRVPQVNAIWTGEGPRLLQDIDICVAVATDSGLITPIVKDAINLRVSEISETVKVFTCHVFMHETVQ